MNFHGGNIYEYHGELLDFSSNINPFGVPISFKKALTERLDEFTRYPDIKYTELKNNIAAYCGVDAPDMLAVGNGAVEIIYKYMSCMAMLGVKRAICPTPTFSEYSRAAEGCGLEVMHIEAYSKDYRELDTELLLNAADKESIVVICNPNNPTGTLVPIETISKLLKALDERGSRLLLDEAFIEFTDGYPSSSAAGLLSSHPNLMLVRAVTKFFGMPGIRLGYGASWDKKLKGRINAFLEPWNINTAAVIAADTVLKDIGYIKNSKEWLYRERSYMYEAINKIKGVKLYSSEANFFLAELVSGSLDAWQLKDKLVEQGILIRTPDGFRSLGKQSFRIAVKDRASNLKLIEALKKVMEEQ